MKAIIDASALLAVLLAEHGSEAVIGVMRDGAMSALNASETFSRVVDKGFSASDVTTLLRQFEIEVIPFDIAQAMLAAELRPKTRSTGASLGDRACLALALTLDRPIYTGDRRLAEAKVGVDIHLIR